MSEITNDIASSSTTNDIANNSTTNCITSSSTTNSIVSSSTNHKTYDYDICKEMFTNATSFLAKRLANMTKPKFCDSVCDNIKEYLPKVIDRDFILIPSYSSFLKIIEEFNLDEETAESTVSIFHRIAIKHRNCKIIKWLSYGSNPLRMCAIFANNYKNLEYSNFRGYDYNIIKVLVDIKPFEVRWCRITPYFYLRGDLDVYRKITIPFSEINKLVSHIIPSIEFVLGVKINDCRVCRDFRMKINRSAKFSMQKFAHEIQKCLVVMYSLDFHMYDIAVGVLLYMKLLSKHSRCTSSRAILDDNSFLVVCIFLARKFNNDREANPFLLNDIGMDLNHDMTIADYISCEWIAFKLLGFSVNYTENELSEIYNFNTISKNNIKFVS
jgi:hypothetical protein